MMRLLATAIIAQTKLLALIPCSEPTRPMTLHNLEQINGTAVRVDGKGVG